MKALVLVACVCVAAPVWASEPSPIVKEGQAIRKLIASHAESWNRRDWNAFLALHSEDFDHVGATGAVGDRSTLERSLARQMQADAPMRPSIRQIRFSRPDLAIVDTSYELAGAAHVTTYIVQKRGGAWLITSARSLAPGQVAPAGGAQD